MPVKPSDKEEEYFARHGTCSRRKETTEGVPLYTVSQVRYGTDRTYTAQETHRCAPLGSDAGAVKRR
jgi:hypothetical protein